MMLGSEKMEGESVIIWEMLCKHEGKEAEIRVSDERQECCRFTAVIKRRNIYMDIKRGLRNSILLPTLMYGSENWTWNGAQQSRVCTVEMSYLRGACEVI